MGLRVHAPTRAGTRTLILDPEPSPARFSIFISRRDCQLRILNVTGPDLQVVRVGGAEAEQFPIRTALIAVATSDEVAVREAAAAPANLVAVTAAPPMAADSVSTLAAWTFSGVNIGVDAQVVLA